ncbi:hypothetical protein QYE76_038278 [Lolium multiflorum]|uniref:Transposase (putative) gypsy type domain-containing protein n=1 Tax=Lolium multiflorum TaxID=4521 RepID=A0AAD8WR04_LOLMU|nr:hypothetical protein QYE76_038278 [Lolium multiflorum]
MREDDIERLVRLRRIPRSVVTRVPGEETEPAPEPGERVVFGAHLDRGLGLPASTFFRQFLDNFGLQPHHLPANACVLLSCFVAFMEAYAGLWPDIDFWSRLFYLKAQTTEGRLRACGAASIYTRPARRPDQLAGVQPLQSAGSTGATTPARRIRTRGEPAVGLPGGSRREWADAEDLCTIAERRVLPLQMRTHKIGHMSGRFDPNRTSKALLSKAQVASGVNNITKANMPDDWNYGLAPRDRDHPPERVSFVFSPSSGLRLQDRLPLLLPTSGLLFAHVFCFSSSLSARTPRTATCDGEVDADHVDPADQAATEPGDDDPAAGADLAPGAQSAPSPERTRPAASTTGPIPAVPLRTRPPSTTATSAPKSKKRAGSTAALEAKAKKLRRLQPKKVPEQAG